MEHQGGVTTILRGFGGGEGKNINSRYGAPLGAEDGLVGIE